MFMDSPAFQRSAGSLVYPLSSRLCLNTRGEGGPEHRGRCTEPRKHNRLKLDEPQRVVNLLSRLDQVRSVWKGGADVESSLITVPPAEREPMNWVPVRESDF